jgi:hypothetical protein
MGYPIFNAKVILSNSTRFDSTHFDIDFAISDATGFFNGTDAQVGDYIFLDTSNYIPGMVSRYAIVSFTLQTYSLVSARIIFDDSDAVMDPVYALGIPGFICHPTAVKQLAIMPSIGIQRLPDQLVTGAINQNSAMLASGPAFVRDTMANLHVIATAAPTVPFIGIPTDLDVLLFYCGKADRGANADGFILLTDYSLVS